MQYGKAPANIDFICFANKGVNHRHRKSRPGIPRDSPRFAFQFAAANHFLRKNLRNLRNGTMVATVAWRHFPSAKRKKLVNVTDSAREILLSGAWTCQENSLDSWITPHVVKPFIKTFALFLCFFCPISSLFVTRSMIEYELSVGSKCNSLKTNQVFKKRTGKSTRYSLSHPSPTRYFLGRCPRIKRSNVHVESVS